MNFSKQRVCVLQYLKNSKAHPTAEQIYADLKPLLPNLSLATVYRNLTQLCQNGSVIRLSAGDKTDHFDADTSDHQHFVCTKCKSVSDLFFRLSPELLDENLEKGFCADSYKMYIYGTCANCRAKKTKHV